MTSLTNISQQAAATANFTSVLETLTSHVAHIIAAAEKHANSTKPGARYSIEPTEAAEQAWSMQIAMRAGKFAGLSGCTPSYFNGEGMMDKMPMEMKMKMAKNGIYGDGILVFQDVLKEWRENGKLDDLDIQI
jgi:hypothetical protein